MAYTIRVSLPGYNALTDTDLDHYALYADSDNFLIKEKARGSLNILGSSGVQPIAHDLGYIPFFLVYVYDYAGDGGLSGDWLQVGNGNIVIWTMSMADTSNLYIYPDGTSNINKFYWYIFYDNVVGSGNPSITQSNYAIKVSKSGVNALTSTNPNNYIFHSDLNTFKIIKEGSATINYSGNGIYGFNHNAGISNPAAFMAFVKFNDGSVTMGNGTFEAQSRNGSTTVKFGINTNQIRAKIYSNVSGTMYVKYYIFETPLI
jgi:hypothetical protein